MEKLHIWHYLRNKIRRGMLEKPFVALATALPILGLFYWLTILLLPPTVDRTFARSLLGGLLASLTAYALVQYFYIQQSHFDLRRWLKTGHRPIWIIPTMITHPSEERYQPRRYFVIPPFDAKAASLLTEIFRNAQYRFPQRQSIGSHLFDEEILSDNLVLTCLPSRNQYTRLFLGIYHDWLMSHKPRRELIDPKYWKRFTDDSDCSLDYFGLRRNPDRPEQWQMLDWSEPEATRWKTSSINRHGIEYVHEPGGDADTDFALVLRAPNPFNPEATILVVCGIHGVGTFGASLWLYKKSMELYKKFGDAPQSHLLRVDYRIPHGRTNYVDAVVVPPTELVATKGFDI